MIIIVIHTTELHKWIHTKYVETTPKQHTTNKTIIERGYLRAQWNSQHYHTSPHASRAVSALDTERRQSNQCRQQASVVLHSEQIFARLGLEGSNQTVRLTRGPRIALHQGVRPGQRTEVVHRGHEAHHGDDDHQIKGPAIAGVCDLIRVLDVDLTA